MIGLRRQEKDIALPENFSANYEVDTDFVEADSMGQFYSWPLKIPREGNELLFNFPEDPDNPRDQLKKYEGFYITVDGTIWQEVVFELLEADEFEYEGTLSTISTAVQENKKVSIRDFITETFDIDFSSKTYFEYTLRDNMVFPPVVVYNEKLLLGSPANMGTHIPFFPLKFLLRKVFQPLGFDLIDNYSDGVAEKILVNSNIYFKYPGSGTITISMAEFVPDISLYDLIFSAAKVLGSEVIVDNDNKKIKINRITRSFQQKPSLEVDSPAITVKNVEKKSIDFFYDYQNDVLIKDNPESITGNFKGDYVDQAAINGAAWIEGDYGLNLQTNKVWIAEDSGFGVIVKREYAYPVMPFLDTKNETSDWVSKLVPAHKTRHTYYEVEGSVTGVEITSGGNTGKIRLTGDIFESLITGDGIVTIDYFNELINNSDKVRVFAETESDFINGQLLDILAVNTSAHTVDIDWDYDSGDVKIKKLIFQQPLDMDCPMIGSRLWNNNEQPACDAYITIFHGLHESISGANILSSPYYPYASPDNYNADGVKVADYSLNTIGSTSLAEKVIEVIRGLLITLRIISAEVTMNEIDFNKALKGNRILRLNRSTNILLKSISCTFTKRGIVNQEIEGYKI